MACDRLPLAIGARADHTPCMGTRRSHDLIIVGGGMTGLALATAVAGAGLDVLVVERQPLEATVTPTFDGRVTAVAQGSKRLLDGVGAWAGMAGEAQPILQIVVGERHSPFRVHYDHEAIGTEPVGYIVENRFIREGLLARARDLVAAGPLRIEAPSEITWVEREPAIAAVDLRDGGRHQAPLIAACDGRGSPLRADAGIGTLRFAYGQTGIVATIGHQQPHHGVAVERFFPTGPFAILPMTGDRSSIVWAADDPLAADITGLSDVAFAEELEERFGEAYGRLEVVGPRYHYPLQMVRSERITDRRLALVGDAARAIHPIAGQGWNLALRDVAALAELIVDEARLGLDPGRSGALERYERWRRFDSLALIAITDGINRLFNNDLLPLRMAREAGLGVVEQIPPLKRLFMRHAMGVLGDLPRLTRGEAL